MKPCALLKLDFLTSAYNKCIALVRKSNFSKAQRIHVSGPSAYAVVPIDKGLFCISVVSYVHVRSGWSSLSGGPFFSADTCVIVRPPSARGRVITL